jgi:hypothetical protein
MWMGLAGLILMALGGRHGRAGVGHGHTHARVGHRGLRTGNGHHAPASFRARALRFVPEPRTVLTLLALFGAFGNVLEHTLRVAPGWAITGALAAAITLELALVRPLWNYALRFQGKPTSPLQDLVLETGHATTPFRNGKGMVEVVHDGRTIQFAASVRSEQGTAVVNVGDALKIVDVDAERERLIVAPV